MLNPFLGLKLSNGPRLHNNPCLKEYPMKFLPSVPAFEDIQPFGEISSKDFEIEGCKLHAEFSVNAHSFLGVKHVTVSYRTTYAAR